jgi:hypothetical protein
MATTIDYIEYVCEQARDIGNIRYRKMFGEYMVYIDEKPILLVCDDTVFIKMLPCIDELMSDAETGYPYDGAKCHYILDIDNAPFVREVMETLLPFTPLPKSRKKK